MTLAPRVEPRDDVDIGEEDTGSERATLLTTGALTTGKDVAVVPPAFTVDSFEPIGIN